MTAGDRQLVREAIAAYFGGSLVTADDGICYQGGPLTSSGLSSAYPYVPKGVPDSYFTQGQAAGVMWGAVMGVTVPDRAVKRAAMAGQTSGWRARTYSVRLELWVISEEPHIETAEAGLDNLIDAIYGLVFADRTLGTTNAVLYPATGRLITQAGEGPSGMTDHADDMVITDKERGRAAGHAVITLDALTMVMA